ncbi:MAG: PAS domain S-box protein [Thermoleophilaceae bacterium]
MRTARLSRTRLAAIRRRLPRGGTLPAEDRARRHRAIVTLTWVALGALVAYSALERTEPLGASIYLAAAAVLALVATAGRFQPGLRAAAASLALLTLAGLLVHVSRGLTEMHTAYLLVVMVLTLYEAWTPLLLAVGFLLLHDGIVGTLDPHAVIEEGTSWLGAWGAAAVYALTAAIAGAVGVLTWRLNEQLRIGLQEGERRHRQIVETANDGIWMLGADGRTNFVNRRMADMLGYTADEMLGKTLFDFMDDEGFAAAAATFAGDRPSDAGQIAVRYRRKDGSPLWVLMSESELMDDELNYAGGLAMVTDVTLMREANAAAHRLAAIVEHANDPIVSTHDDVIVSWNLAAEELFGYSEEEIVGRPVSVLMPPEVPEGEVKQVGDRVRAGQTLTFDERELVCKGGERLIVNTRLSPLRGENGEIVGVSGFYRDIREQISARAEREQLELRLQQSQRLETVGQLAGGIAHDFNNLLAVILNYSDFLRDELPEGEQARDDVEQIHRAAERAAGLTRQLLVFSRREVARPKVLDMNHVVEVAEKLLRRTIGEHIEFTTMLDEELGRVEIDEGQLEQVLVNLVVNARDAMPADGSLTVETANVEIDEATTGVWGSLAAGRYARLNVTDTGTGMPPDVVERAFEPFFTTKAVGEGTGLGLATVYGIVQNAGGHALIYSEPGRGTAVKAYLSLVETEQEEAAAGEPPPRGQGETILLVQDEDAVRESTRRILADSGYQVVVATNGIQALEIWEERTSIDLVLTDVVMPRMSGEELAGELAADARVLYMSGYTDHQIRPDQVGMLVEKPFGSAQLLRKVREALSAR